MKRAPIIAILLLLLTACDTVQPEEAPVEVVDVFERNLACQSQKDDLIEVIESRNNNLRDEELMAIYYHENLKTCVYTAMLFEYEVIDGFTELTDVHIYLYELFTKAKIGEPLSNEYYQDFIDRTSQLKSW